MAVAVLLARDLAGGHLVEEFLGAIGDLEPIEGRRPWPGHDRRDVGEQLVGDGAAVGLESVDPEVLLEPVETGELQPSATTSSRPSMAGSRSPKDSATGSMRSHGARATAYLLLAVSTSPDFTAVTNSVVLVSNSSACAATHTW